MLFLASFINQELTENLIFALGNAERSRHPWTD